MNWVRVGNLSSPKLRFGCLKGREPEKVYRPLGCEFKLSAGLTFDFRVNDFVGS